MLMDGRYNFISNCLNTVYIFNLILELEVVLEELT